MVETEVVDHPKIEISAEKIREQLDLLVRDHAFRSSKRSIAFLRYVVEQTLNGSADLIKERTIGVEVFDGEPSYDTNLDHVVRTAATELRKRLAIYYGEEKHRSEFRIGLIPGSYIPRFTLPEYSHSALTEPEIASEPGVVPLQTQSTSGNLSPELIQNKPDSPNGSSRRRSSSQLAFALVAILVVAGFAGYIWLHRETTQALFWKPVLETPVSVLVAVGDVPNGPPIPFADTVTIARVVGALEANGKKVVIRRESDSSFSDLREGPLS